MAEKKKKTRSTKPAMTPESRELQMINKAIDLAERQLDDGTAPPSVVNHYLKLGTKKEHMERDILEKQSLLLEAKVSHMSKDDDSKKLIDEAIKAMQSYKGG